jgi:uncharacterized repeat protein (TIGR01451 family)
MNKSKLQIFFAAALCLSLPILSWADLTNTASATYKDAASNSYTATSNTVTVTVTLGTKPSITSATAMNGDIGVALNYQIVASNSPTSYNATSLPAGVTINTATGLISGTPTASGPSTVNLSATNAAGTGTATLTLTVRPAAVITLTKSSNLTSAASGATVTFTIQYQNTTAGAASNVVITDVVPTGSTLVSGSISNGGSINSNTITWTVGTVAGNGSGSVSFQAKVN